jgi:hypothetical protein
VASAEYIEPQCEVHRISDFFKSSIPLPGRISIVYQYNGSEINFSRPPFYAFRAFYYQEVTPMTDQERTILKAILQEQKQYHVANPAAARAFLLGTGIYTADGNLTPEYGGPKESDEGKEAR